MSQHLVHGIVPADVLAEHLKLAVEAEQAGRVQAPGGGEGVLRGAEARGQSEEDLRIEEALLGQRAREHPKPIDARLAAHAAAAGRVQLPGGALDGLPVGLHAAREDAVDGVPLGIPRVVDMTQRHQVIRTVDDALGVEEAGRQIEIVTGGPHRDRQRAALDADLEGLLGDHRVHVGPIARVSTDRPPGDGTRILAGGHAGLPAELSVRTTRCGHGH